MITKTVRLPGRNDPCVCRSGRKFKLCCLQTIAKKEAELREILDPINRCKVTAQALEVGMDIVQFQQEARMAFDRLIRGR